jgi:carbon monoxide dehydrogenase subunit G
MVSGLVYEAGTAVAVAAVSAARYQKRIGEISYRVDAEAGGVSETLAGGVTEPVAFALRKDVSSLLGLN